MNGTETQITYSYLNDELLSEFQGQGTEQLIQLIEAPAQPDVDAYELVGTVFTELIMVLEDGKLDPEAIIEFLSSCIKDEETANHFCQVLNLFPLSEPVESLIKKLHTNQKVIQPSSLAKFLSTDTLGKLGIVPGDTLSKQLNTRKRDEYYTQKKFNLLHEEPEGFARLIVELMNILRSGESESQVDYAIKMVDTIIGHYSLDPNRVFDVTFDCFSNSLISNEKFIIAFYKKSLWWPQVNSDNSSLNSLSLGGDDDLAKIIGLRLVKPSEDKAFAETTKLLIAILIKEGLVSFGSVYKFFGPDDEQMAKLERLHKKGLEEEVFKSSANALALAAPLMDEEESEGSSTNTNKKTGDLTTEEQIADLLGINLKFQMLKSFLAVGLYWPSVFILTEYPFLALVDEEVGELICRLYHHMITPLYGMHTNLLEDDLAALSKPKQIAIQRPNNEVYYQDYTPHTYLTFKATTQDYFHKRFVYFYDNWTSGLPLIHSSEQLFQQCQGLLKFLNVQFAKDIQLFVKICKIGVSEIESSGPTDEWFTFFRNQMFPAISVLQENSIAVENAYQILSFYPKENRFNLYSEFHQVTSKNNPYIKISYGKAEKNTKDVLKRLSKETVRPMMRRIAKISFCNPLPCFLTILQQIESYDNLNSLVVETARYFNSYGWDVLTLAIMMRVTASGRSNIQTNGLFERQWIQSLASFVGKICHRYPNSIDISTLLEFILKSLHSNDTSVLTIFKEMLLSMGGLTSSNNLTLDQIYRLNSGDTLKRLIYSTINDTRYSNSKAGTILVKNLVELDCVNEFLVLLYQMNENVTYEDNELHLKVITNRKDDLSTVMQLFCDLINFYVQDELFDEKLSPISKLSYTCHVPPEWVFEIWRKHMDPYSNDFLAKDMEGFKPYLGDYVWQSLSPGLYSTFWQLSLYDVNYVDYLYISSAEKHQNSLESLETSYTKSKRAHASRQDIESKKDAFEVVQKLVSDIPVDQQKHESHYNKVIARITEESSSWFVKNDEGVAMKMFLQYCILPRAVHSSFDAVYSAKFVFKLFQVGVQKFSLEEYLNYLFQSRVLFGTFFTSTLTESENLGLFFSELLIELNSWCNNETFEKLTNGLTNKEGVTLSFKGFKDLLYSYHTSLLDDLLTTLNSTDYMCRRNSIIFLKNIIHIYPVVEDQCEQLAEVIQQIINTEEREDLKLAVNALIGHIKARQSKWIHLWDFIEMPEAQLEVHRSKREAIANEIRKINEAKRLKEQLEYEERERIQKERAETLRREKEAEALKVKEKQKLSYDESSQTTSTRADVRKDGVESRKDYYSKYENFSKASTPSGTRPTSENGN
ncbi:hypothetical protein CANTEDRAFT_118856, partial [Yamadazyma tenuis ATCC 10573]